MEQTAVEWLLEKYFGNTITPDFEYFVKKAKEMENKEKLIKQLFIGKVSEIIGNEKTIELLKECNETFKSK